MNRVAIAAFVLLGLSQIWTISRLEKLEDRLEIVTTLLTDSYLDEAYKACRRSDSGVPFPKPDAKRSGHYLSASRHKELGMLFPLLVLYTDWVSCYYDPKSKRAAIEVDHD